MNYFKDKTKLLIINGSPRSDKISNTYKVLWDYAEYIQNKYSILKEYTQYIKLPVDMQGCIDCGNCIKKCNINDGIQSYINLIEGAKHIILGSPVYLDMPTPQTVAFLTRLNCMAENTNREFFRGKKMYLVSTAYCSGTKQVISIMRNACEMLGFDIEGRSSREYIQLWKDKKIRGGMSKKDSIYLKGIE